MSRGQGDPLIEEATYISGLRIYDNYCGLYRHYPRDDVVSSKIILVSDAPPEYNDPQIFLKEIDRVEKYKNAQTVRHLTASLPVELSRDEQLELAYASVEEYWVGLGMCAYVCIHDKGIGNPHLHALLTTRDVDRAGFKAKNRAWDKKEVLLKWREFWANLVNRALERKGLEIRVSHLSYLAQGLDIVPTKYLGAKRTALERAGISTDRGNENREIMAERQQKLKAEQELKAKKARKKRRRRGRSY